MESLKKEQLNHMPISTVNFLDELPDVVFYAVMEKLPGRVIENTVRQLSKNCYRRVELRRARLPHFYIDGLYVYGKEFCYRRPGVRARRRIFDYQEMIDPANLIQHLEYLKERATFKSLMLEDVDWDMFANCRFECEELSCRVFKSTLSPEIFVDIFRSIRPTRKLRIGACGDNKIFPVTSDFFTNNYAIGLQEVFLYGTGDAMVDPLNDTILLDLTLLYIYADFERSSGCTLNGILTMIRDWYTSELQIGRIELQAVGGQAEVQNFLHNLPGLLVDKRVLLLGNILSIRALERANGDLVELGVCRDAGIGHIRFRMVGLVPATEADLYRHYNDIG